MKFKSFLKTKKGKTVFLLILIVLLALFLRVWQLDSVPPSLFGDEVDTGYQAFSILKTGQDYFGNQFPIHFQSFGDWRVPLYIYLDTVFVKIFGLNGWGVRLPAAIFGTLAVLITFFLTRLFTKNEKVALLASFLLAISPWHLHFSRGAFEAILVTFLFPLGLVLLFKGLEKKRISLIILSAVSFGLTLYAYNTPKLFLPLIMVGLFFIFRKEFWRRRKELAIFLVVLGLVLLPQLIETFKGSGGARFKNISIFSNQEVGEEVRLERDFCSYPGPLEKTLHNKVRIWTQDLTNNYLRAYSLEFLFLSGDPSPRHSVEGRGMLYLFELPFLLLGLGVIVYQAFKKKNLFSGFLLFWFLLAPIPASLTQNGGTHAIRLLLFLPAYQIIVAIGIMAVFKLFKRKEVKRIFAVLLTIVILISFGSYLHDYHEHFPKASAYWWNYGYQEAFDYIRENEKGFDKIYVSSSWEPSIVYTLFYSQYPPDLTQKEIEISPVKIGKYYFLSPDIERLKNEGAEPKTLYVLSPGEMEASGLILEESPFFKKIKDIITPDGSRIRVVFTGRDSLK